MLLLSATLPLMVLPVAELERETPVELPFRVFPVTVLLFAEFVMKMPAEPLSLELLLLKILFEELALVTHVGLVHVGLFQAFQCFLGEGIFPQNDRGSVEFLLLFSDFSFFFL